MAPQPQTCEKEHMVWNDCGSPCDQTCEMNQAGIMVDCMKMCKPRCECEKGYTITDAGECVPDDQCELPKPTPSCNGPNEHFEDCGSPCQETCEDRQKGKPKSPYC